MEDSLATWWKILLGAFPFLLYLPKDEISLAPEKKIWLLPALQFLEWN